MITQTNQLDRHCMVQKWAAKRTQEGGIEGLGISWFSLGLEDVLFCYEKLPQMSGLEACLVYCLTVLQMKHPKWISEIYAPREIPCPCLFSPGGHLNVLILWLCIL